MILTWYQVGVNVTCVSGVCTLNPNITLPNDVYDWEVQPWTGDYGDWYTPFTFTVNADVPDLISPADGSSTADNTPEYQWEETTGASWYQLHVYQQGGSDVILTWYEVGVNVTCASGTCTLDPNIVLPNDIYEWQVQPWIGDYGVWYGPVAFTVNAP